MRRVASLALASAALACVALAAASAPMPTHAQPRAADAGTVAARVQAYYDQVRSFTADFQQTARNRLYNKQWRSSGHLFFKKPGRFRFDYVSPTVQHYVSDGTTLQAFQAGDRGQPGQLAVMPAAESELASALPFLSSAQRLSERFSLRLLDSRGQRFATGSVLELTPRTPLRFYDRLLLFVEGRPGLAPVVHRVLAVQAGGTVNHCEFVRATTDAARTPDTLFRFTPPPGPRRVRTLPPAPSP